MDTFGKGTGFSCSLWMVLVPPSSMNRTLMSQVADCPSPFQPFSPKIVYFQIFGDIFIILTKVFLSWLSKILSFFFFFLFVLDFVGSREKWVVKSWKPLSRLGCFPELEVRRLFEDMVMLSGAEDAQWERTRLGRCVWGSRSNLSGMCSNPAGGEC